MADSFVELLERARRHVRPPVLIALGAPRLAVELARAVNSADTVAFQLDRYQADRLGEYFAEGVPGRVEVAADLWDVPGPFATVVLPAPPRGERELKRDLVEQAYHVLQSDGQLVVLSPVGHDDFFPDLLKKTYKKTAVAADEDGTVIWGHRGPDRPRRRHERALRVRLTDDSHLNLMTRPGVFGYGKLDLGARALIEVMEIHDGQAVVELGCGTAATGIAAAKAGGGMLTLVDSNARACALAELNAQANGLTKYRVVLSADGRELPAKSADVVLANPPYYGNTTIAARFVRSALETLRPGGRLYVVTKQLELEAVVTEAFGPPVMLSHRDYTIMLAKRRGR